MWSPAPGEVKWGVNVDLFIYSISSHPTHQCIIPSVYLQFAQNLEPLERLLSFAAETFQIIVFLPNFPVEVVSFCFLCTVRTVSGVSGLVQPAPSDSCPGPDKTRQSSWRESVPVWGRLWEMMTNCGYWLEPSVCVTYWEVEWWSAPPWLSHLLPVSPHSPVSSYQSDAGLGTPTPAGPHQINSNNVCCVLYAVCPQN